MIIQVEEYGSGIDVAMDQLGDLEAEANQEYVLPPPPLSVFGVLTYFEERT